MILVFTGLGAWIFRGRGAFSGILGAGGCVAAAAMGLWGVGNCLFFRQIETRRELWNVPYGSLSLGLDSLSALFLVPAFLVGGMAAMSALRRLPGDYATNRPREHWLFFNLTLASAVLAILARNAVLFLFAWETMTVASFLLVENDQRESGARSGGWVYLTAGHLGGACLFAMFAILGNAGGKLDFSSLAATGTGLSIAFALAFAGFGGKVGLAPFHAWYPESYPAAPAHVGAILSGVIGNLGIYGLARFLNLFGKGEPPPEWWAYLLLAGGLASALLGAARSLASRDLSRLLAWSSLENYGLMATGLGLGLLGSATGNGMVSFLGFAGAIIHMLNHSISKGLLFLAAGTIYARTGTRDLNRMGGLLKRIPLTGLLFLVGGLGAAAIPPLNGFVGEFLLLMAAYNGVAGGAPTSLSAAAMVVAVAAVATVGGLAAAAYIKAFGFVFLGNPRGPGSASTGAERRGLLVPQCILAGLALLAAGLSPRLIDLIGPSAETLARLWSGSPTGVLGMEAYSGTGGDVLYAAAIGSWLLAGCVAFAFLIRFALMRGKRAAKGLTWDCGYAAPGDRMQYNASSFARPLAETFDSCVTLEDKEQKPEGLFPGQASFSSSTPGVNRAWGYSQVFSLVAKIASRVQAIQTGQVHTYLLYMGAVLVILLLWKL